MAEKSIVRVRFAPSPTGLLHIGGLRTALYNYLVARRSGGSFIVRIEDTDQARYVEGAEAYIYESLAWAGIEADESPNAPGECGPYRQSERTEIYRMHADELVARGSAYLAFDTEEEVDALRTSGPGDGGVRYDATTRGSMRNSESLSDSEVRNLVDAGHPHVVRLKVPSGKSVTFVDRVRGEVTFSTDEVDDQVLIKSDGFPTYHLANVVDDHAMHISHVIRGEEWLPSTPKHILLYEAFGWDAPEMAHLPLILSPTGGKLSKRNAKRYGIPIFVLEYRDAGYEAEAVVNYLALLGWHPGSDRERFNLSELAAEFSLDRVGSAGVQFDIDKLRWFNEQVLRELPTGALVEAVRPHLVRAGFTVNESSVPVIVELLRDRLTLASDVLQFTEFFADPESYDDAAVRKSWKDETSDLVRELAGALDGAAAWTAPELSDAFESFVASKEVGKRRVMPAMRIALSGRSSGPDLFPTLEILGRDTSLRRLRQAADRLKSPAQR